MDGDAVDNFASWLTPDAACAAVPGGVYLTEKTAWIQRRLSEGLIVACAESAVFRSRNGGVHRHQWFALEQAYWRSPWRSIGPNLWDTGDVELTNGPESYEISGPQLFTLTSGEPELPPEMGGDRFNLFGIRFDPAGFGSPDNPTPLPTTRKPQLARDEQERFARLYVGLWAERTVEKKALAAIRACYPDNTISQDPFYETFRSIRGPKKRGKAALAGKDSA